MLITGFIFLIQFISFPNLKTDGLDTQSLKHADFSFFTTDMIQEIAWISTRIFPHTTRDPCHRIDPYQSELRATLSYNIKYDPFYRIADTSLQIRLCGYAD